MSQTYDKVGSNVSLENSNEPAFNDQVLLANDDVFTGLHSKCQSSQMLVCSCQCNLKNVSDASPEIENVEANFESVNNVDCQHNVCVFKCSCAVVPQVSDSVTVSHVNDSVAVSLVGDSATAAQQCDNDSVVVAHVDSGAVATHVLDMGATSLMADGATAPHINQTVCDFVGDGMPGSNTGFVGSTGVVAGGGVSGSQVTDSVTGPSLSVAATVPCSAASAGAQGLVGVTNGDDISASHVSDSDAVMPIAGVTHTIKNFHVSVDECQEGTTAPPGSAKPPAALGPTQRAAAPGHAWDQVQSVKVHTTFTRAAQVQPPEKSVAVVQSHKCECCETKIVHCNIYEYLAQDSDAECSKSDDDDLDIRIHNLWLEQPSNSSESKQADWCASEPIYFNRLLSRASKWGKPKRKLSRQERCIEMSQQLFPADVVIDSQDTNVVHVTDGAVQATGNDSVPVTQPCNVQLAHQSFLEFVVPAVACTTPT